MNKGTELIEKLEKTHHLEREEYLSLLKGLCPETAEELRRRAERVRRAVYGKYVYIRGLIEVSNICRNDCLYCGIRRSNSRCERYRLSTEDILSCCEEGYRAGLRTFVLQGGEDGAFTDGILVMLIHQIKGRYPDCAVTLSLGERTRESYLRLYEAGADRYLLRHETADPEHYGYLHPEGMSFARRMECLHHLKEIGYQVGCGMMVGSPGQTAEMLAEDLQFIETFDPDMCGIGPFIPHRDTPFGSKSAGSVELTCCLLSIVRLMHPHILLPATTALASIDPAGREKGILSGANVVMPNLSPLRVREKYALYDGKAITQGEAVEGLNQLRTQLEMIGYEIVTDRGDVKRA